MKYIELENFAKYFHQDFGALFDSAETGANEYLGTLTKKQRRILSNEIAELLKEHTGKDLKSLKNAWFRLGAQWWNKQELSSLLNHLSTN